jgi:hypothetical protein
MPIILEGGEDCTYNHLSVTKKEKTSLPLLVLHGVMFS